MPADALSLILSRAGALARPGLLSVLASVPDPRKARGVRHSFTAVVAVSVCAVLAGARSFVAIGEWAGELPAGLRARLGFGRGVPCETTIRRVLQRIDPAVLDEALTRWLAQVPPGIEEEPAGGLRVVAIDGKTVRGARTEEGQVHLLAALETATGSVLGQVKVHGKSNEITAFPLLVRGIDLAGALVTADAMHTQRSHVELLKELGAHWLLTVKDNQPKLRAQLAALPWKEVPIVHNSVTADHGRHETRTLQVVEVKRGIAFPGAKLALRITRRRRLSGRRASTETVLAITDLTWHQITPAALAEAMRAHWGIENRLHWVRDVTFGEDHSQVRTGHGPAVMAGLRNFAIGLHRRRGTTNIAQACRRVSRHPARALALIE